MKTLLNAKDKDEIVRRLETIRPESRRRWGKMSAHQMVCHLSDSFRVYMGEKTVTPAPGRYPRKPFKWAALWLPLRWPHGFKTRPEMDQQIGGTPPAEFGNDMRELQLLLDRYTRKPRDFDWPPHPFFGQLSDEDWLRLGYLHMDHHLRQFGA